MGSKNNPGNFDCYGNALPDEPMFILLARDPSAPEIVKWWADAREAAIDRDERPESDRAMVEEARECAKNMRQWRADNDGKWRNGQPRNAEAVAWRHKKRGSTYVEVTRGELQSEPSADLCEGDEMIAYRGSDGRVWFRRVEEFEDGRFERVASPSNPQETIASGTRSRLA